MLSAEGEGKYVTLKATGVNLTPLAVFLGKLYSMGAVSDKKKILTSSSWWVSKWV